MASVEGTQRFLQRVVGRQALHASNARRLGPFACTAVGYGAYRLESEAQVPALRQALNVMNVIDTSSHYAAGLSERLVGRVLREAEEAQQLSRDEIIVCTKVGHVSKGQEPPKGAVPIGAHKGEGGAQDDWHCIAPDFVGDEVRSCKERLGTSPDFVLLHNPEYLLTARLQQQAPIADAWDEMYQALFESFKSLEQLCSEGSITSGYGVSSNFLSCLFSVTGRANLYEALVLDRVADAAAAAAKAVGVDCRFRMAQLPLNAFEGGAVIGRGKAVEAERDCDLAQRLGISLMTNRPLNALPMPGVSTGDWGRGGSSHLQLREAKPMGTMGSLLKRVLREAADLPEAPLQQMALRLALSAPGVACTLNGVRRPEYVEDAAQVLKLAPLSHQDVEKALLAVRSLAEELGCDAKQRWCDTSGSRPDLSCESRRFRRNLSVLTPQRATESSSIFRATLA